MNKIESLIAEAENVWTSEPASLSVIAGCEARLNLKFPPSYCSFLQQFGAMDVGGNSISGIIENSLDDLGGGSVVGDTLRFREEWELPANLVVIQANDEAPYCLEIDNGSPESPVVCYELHSRRCKVVASSFAEWVGPFVFGESNG